MEGSLEIKDGVVDKGKEKWMEGVGGGRDVEEP